MYVLHRIKSCTKRLFRVFPYLFYPLFYCYNLESTYCLMIQWVVGYTAFHRIISPCVLFRTTVYALCGKNVILFLDKLVRAE